MDVDSRDLNELMALELHNSWRPYLGLNQIDKRWDTDNIGDKITLFYQDDVIVKIVYKELLFYKNVFKSFTLTEYDTNIQTRNREMLLPKTKRGKEKSMTPSNILNASGYLRCFSFHFPRVHSVHISAYNMVNKKSLPIVDYEWIKCADDFNQCITNYINTCNEEYMKKVDFFKNKPYKRVKYAVGDVFRFEIDRVHYGYGLIIGKIRDIKKWPELPNEHPFRNMLMQPILVRIYKIKTKNTHLTCKELNSIELLPTETVCDNDIIWGVHDIIDNKRLTVEDIEFPVHYGVTIDAITPPLYFLTWGFATLLKDPKSTPKELRTGILSKKEFSNRGVSGINTHSLNNVLDGRSAYNRFSDIRHPENTSIKNAVFQLYGVPLDIEFDEFSRKYNGITRKEYIERLYKNKK